MRAEQRAVGREGHTHTEDEAGFACAAWGDQQGDEAADQVGAIDPLAVRDCFLIDDTDGGATWTIQFENQNPNAFYDGFAFWTPNRGIAHSDSVNGVFPDLRTTDGMTWQDISNNMPAALPAEVG